MKRGWYWPLLLAGLLVAGILANLTMLMLASGDPAFSVEPNYYAKAVAWNEHMDQVRRNAELGWTVVLTSSPSGVTIDLADRTGHAVSGAQLKLEAFPLARGNQVVSVSLEETAEHRYGALVPLGRPGLWEFRLTAKRGADTFTALIDQDVPGGER